MKNNNNNLLWSALGILAGVGGLAHVLQGFMKYDLLSVFGVQLAPIIQGISGLAILYVAYLELIN